MKKLIFIIIILIIPSLLAQNKRQLHKDQMNKIEQLEKIKLIEILNLNEEATLRFFARFNEHRQQMEEYKKEADDYLGKLKLAISKPGKNDNLKESIDSYLALGEKASKSKSEFTNSLSDILTDEQIAKFLVFEMKFREDIRGMLFKMRGKPGGRFP